MTKAGNTTTSRDAEPAERTAEPKSIHAAFVKVCAAVENVKRDTKGQVGNSVYKYATLESVLEMLHPLLAKEGLALAQYVNEDMLFARLISMWGEEMPFGAYNLGQLDKHQARGSAITYGRRYQLCAIFGITQEDDDGAAASQSSNTGPTSGKSPREVYPSSTAMKADYEKIKGWIQQAVEPEHFIKLAPFIAKIRSVDDHMADTLEDAILERQAVLND